MPETLSALAGLIAPVAEAQEATKLHRFHSRILSSWWLFWQNSVAELQVQEACSSGEIWVNAAAMWVGRVLCGQEQGEGYKISLTMSAAREMWTGWLRFPLFSAHWRREKGYYWCFVVLDEEGICWTTLSRFKVKYLCFFILDALGNVTKNSLCMCNCLLVQFRYLVTSVNADHCGVLSVQWNGAAQPRSGLAA